MRPLRRKRLGRLFVIGTIAAIAAVATPAAFGGVTPWAGMGTSVSTACADQALVRPFLPWNDFSNYTFAPNGGLETGATGWALSGGASVVSVNEPYRVHGGSDSHSLSLPAGATATSPATCMGAFYPFARLLASGPNLSQLKVQLLYVDAFGAVRSQTLGTQSGHGVWELSSRLAASSTLVSTSSPLGWWSGLNRYTAVAYRFTAVAGSWKIDDLYVDPFKLH